MGRAPAVLTLVALVALAGCVGSLGDDSTETPAGSLPDPENDVSGWEDGYWYNESIDVTADDGLSDAELERLVARAKARVETIRDVEFAGSVAVRTVPRSELGGGGGGSTPAPATRRFDNAKLEALLLVGEDNDSLAIQRRNRQIALGGYYSPANDRIVVVTDGGDAVVDETTLAHELMHAWQDQRFNLGSFRSRTRDGNNAVAGIIEGDANYVEYRYTQRCGTTWDCVTPTSQGAGGNLANYGVYVMKFFPYSDGPSFVAAIRAQGGWEAVNAVYGDPPASAEQVAHPEAYGTDQPTAVTLRDRTAGGWERVRPPGRPDYATVGQAGIAALLVYPLYHSGGNTTIVPADVWFNRTAEGEISRFDPLNYGFDYANGWDGDRLHVYRNNGGETGYVWRIVWDSPAEATEFLDGYRQVLRYWGAERVGEHTWRIDEGPFADAFHVSVQGATVTIVNAPTVDQLSRVRTTLGDGRPPAGGTATTTPSASTPPPFDAPAPGIGVLAGLLATLLAAAWLARR